MLGLRHRKNEIPAAAHAAAEIKLTNQQMVK
jgi:hypothetical protein